MPANDSSEGFSACGGFILWIGTALMSAAIGGLASAIAPLGYPAAVRDAQVDVYHGVKVADPYRWLEDIDSADTRAWVSAEDRMSRGFLDSISGRAKLEAQLRKVWNFERWSPPERYGRTWLYTHNDGLQNQSVVFVTEDPGAPGRILIDPNKLSADGTVALRETAMSADGRLFAYALSDAGSDWQVWHVRDVATGKDLPDTLQWSKFGGASWRKDGSGFYYTAYDPPKSGNQLKSANEYQKLFFHRLGTPQSGDTLVYVRTDNPGWIIAATVSDDGRYLVIQSSLGTDERNTVAVQDLTKPNAPMVPIIPAPTATFDFIGNAGKSLLLRTDESAPHFRIVSVDLRHPDPPDRRTVIAEGADTIESATLAGGKLIVQRLKDAHSAVARYTAEGRLLGTVELPGLGTAAGFFGHGDDARVYYTYSSYSTPPSVFSLELASGTTTLWRSPQLEDFTPSEFETHQVFYSSKDGTRVPMFITARKGTPLSGNNPTILYGYGGFNTPLTPGFSPMIAAWLQLGGVYAVANLRGGGEYGRAWHEAGMKTHKQNVFDDFIAAAEYLRTSHWTSPARLALSGRSNGGLLIGAVEEERPDIAAAAVPQVGVMDMLRFRQFTIGKAWESDYGSVDNPAEFKALYSYSPYHNVKSGVNYPATLIMTSDHDDRVFPAHSFKFAAAMQHADPQGNPILLRVETRAGHGQGIPTAKLIGEVVDIYAFILHAFGMDGASG
ncbi:MAG TPA: prolyl oligopeptidase family serine peptidase [Steroidobacteraceae bacterium]